VPPRPNAATDAVAFYPPGFYWYPAGTGWDWRGEQFLARPREIPLRADASPPTEKPRSIFFARGFGYHLSRQPRDWSGVQLVAAANVRPSFVASALFHHELREQVGSFGQVSTAARLSPGWHILSSLGAGNGAEFLPITQLDAELRREQRQDPKLDWGLGAGASWWSQRRFQVTGTAGLMLWLLPTLSGEQRLHIHHLDSPSADGRWLFRTTTTLFEGQHGKRTFQQRISVGLDPELRFGADLSDRPTRFTYDFGAGFREWIEPHYGYVLNAQYGGQYRTYTRLGFDFAVFVTL
jgi:hypothetical protein